MTTEQTLSTGKDCEKPLKTLEKASKVIVLTKQSLLEVYLLICYGDLNCVTQSLTTDEVCSVEMELKM